MKLQKVKRYGLFSIISILLITLSCKQKNRLTQDESHLIEDLKSEEAGLLTKESAVLLPSTRNNTSIMEGIREVDQESPPIVLDIVEARNHLKEISIEDIGKNIRYIPIRFPEPPDSIWNSIMDFNFLITPNNIIAYNIIYGLSQFDLQGNFIEQVVKNDFYYSVEPSRNISYVSPEDRASFEGVKGFPHAIGDQIYYQYHLANTKQAFMMHYDASPGRLSGNISSRAEESDINAAGDQLFPFSKHGLGEKLFFFIARDIPTEQMGAPNIFPINDEEWVTVKEKMDRNNISKDFLTISNSSGDTLASFKDADPVRNFKGSAYRVVDYGDQYFYNGRQHIRQVLNDTIYVLSAINILTAKYVIDFGDLGIGNSIKALSAGPNLENKFILNQFIESDNYLFIVYTQNNDSPINAGKGVLKYNACIYDKINKELFHVYMDEEPFFLSQRSFGPPINAVQNPNGLPFWPKSITQRGIPFTWIKGLDIKSWPVENLQESDPVKKFTREMRDDDYLLIVLE